MASELVLITGGAGFIGCHTALELLARGYRVRALDALVSPVHANGEPPPWLPPEVELLKGDVRDRDALAGALRGVTRVLHLAAHQDYLPDFSTFFHVNTVGTALLYELIVEGGFPVAKVVVASSQAVYGEGAYACARDGEVHPGIRPDAQLRRGDWEVRCPRCGGEAAWRPTSEAVLNPQNHYAVSKQTQEMVALSLGRRYGIPTTCLRYSITQGRWQSPHNPYSGICRIFTLRALAGRPAVVFEDGGQLRDYVHVGEVARANLLCLEDPRTDFEAYNVGGAEPLSALQFAAGVRSVVGGPEPELPGLYRFGDTRHAVSDSTRLRELGWKPAAGVEQAIAEYAEWAAAEGFPDRTEEGLARMLDLGTVRRSEPAPRRRA